MSHCRWTSRQTSACWQVRGPPPYLGLFSIVMAAVVVLLGISDDPLQSLLITVVKLYSLADGCERGYRYEVYIPNNCINTFGEK